MNTGATIFPARPGTDSLMTRVRTCADRRRSDTCLGLRERAGQTRPLGLRCGTVVIVGVLMSFVAMTCTVAFGLPWRRYTVSAESRPGRAGDHRRSASGQLGPGRKFDAR